MKTYITLSLACLLLYGCAPFPIQQVREYSVLVNDDSGSPVTNATMHFATHMMSIIPKDQIETFKSNSKGQIHISGKTDWQLVFLAPDGAALYDWGWCVEKNGYMPVAVNQLKENVSGNSPTITLKKSNENAKCNWDERYFFTIQKQP